jgi:O-glycosyl hydrolase
MRSIPLVLLLLMSLPARAATISVDGTQTNQVIDGFGVNANHRSWNGTELRPVLDALIDQAGMTLFRVVFDETNWEAINDNTNSAAMDWTYYNTVYGSNTFSRLWDMTAYLNSRGLTNGVFFNFMGRGPAWLGGGTLTAGQEDEWAEMITSLLMYARNTKGLQFKLIAPDNEPDISNEGITMSAARYTNCLHKLALKLDANGLSDLRFVAPDLAGNDASYRNAIAADSTIMAKLAHWGVHSYGSSAGIINDPARTYWVTEFNVWCNTCDSGVRGTYDWNYCRGTAEYLLNHLVNGAAGGIVWEGYDSFYLHPPSTWSFWGLLSVDNENVTPKTYTPRKNFYTLAQISKFVRPGAQRVEMTGSTAPFSPLLAFKHTGLGQVTIVGINNSVSSAILTGAVSALPAVASLDLYYTSATTNLARAGSVPVNSGTFTATIPANCIFTLTGAAAISVAITNPANGAAFTPPATIPIQTVASTTNASITQVQFFNGATLLGTDTTAPFSLTWNSVPAGTYALTACVTDNTGLVATSAVVNVTVATTGGGTIGNTSDGTATDTIWDNGAWINAGRFQAMSNMVVDTMHAKVVGLTGHYKCAIYDDSYRLLRGTVEATNPTTGWQTLPLTASLTLTNGNYYWLAIWSDSSTAGVYYNGTGTLRWGKYTSGPWPDPISFAGNGSYNYCLFATGTAPPSAYETWKTSYGLTGAADTSDGDGDGIPLLIEYALNLGPTAPNVTGLPVFNAHFEFSFLRARAELNYEVQSSTNLIQWTPLAINPGNVGEEVTVLFTNNAPSAFLRLKVSGP